MRSHARFASLLPLAAAFIVMSSGGNARPTDDLLQDLNVTGTATDTVSQVQSDFTGTLDVTGVLIDPSGNLVVQGIISGLASGDNNTTGTDGDDDTSGTDDVTTSVVGQVFSTSATLSGRGEERCNVLTLDLDSLNLELLGLQLDLSEVELDIDAEKGRGKLLGSLLCSLTSLLDNPDLAAKAQRIIGRINTILGGLLTNVPVTAPLADNTTFTGFLTVTSVAVNEAGDLVLNGVLNGVVDGSDDGTTRVINQAFAATAELTGGDGGEEGKCEILTLDLGPLNLDLLGLNIDLSPVSLDIRGLQGTGNLLGNMLCKLAGLLDSGSTGGSLNSTLRKINSLLD